MKNKNMFGKICLFIAVSLLSGSLTVHAGSASFTGLGPSGEEISLNQELFIDLDGTSVSENYIFTPDETALYYFEGASQTGFVLDIDIMSEEMFIVTGMEASLDADTGIAVNQTPVQVLFKDVEYTFSLNFSDYSAGNQASVALKQDDSSIKTASLNQEYSLGDSVEYFKFIAPATGEYNLKSALKGNDTGFINVYDEAISDLYYLDVPNDGLSVFYSYDKAFHMDAGSFIIIETNYNGYEDIPEWVFTIVQEGGEDPYAIPEGYTGFYELSDGWYYCQDGSLTDYTELLKGTVNGITTWWKVVDGKVSFTDGLAANKNGLYYVTAGAVNFNYTGFVSDENDWYYVSKGKVRDTTELVKGTVNGVNTYWKVVGGKVSFTNGLASNSNGLFYVTSGAVDFSFTGFAQDDQGDWYYLSKGKARGITALTKGTVNGITTWWNVVNDKVMFTTGLASNSSGTFYVKNGAVDFGFTGFMQNTDEDWYYISKGKLRDTTALVKGTVNGVTTYWKVVDGKVSFTNGLASNSNGLFYVTSGAVDFSFTGFAQDDQGDWYYLSKGKARGITALTKGTVNGLTTWWNVVNDKISFTTGLASNSNGTFFVRDGKVDFTYNGTWTENGITYTIVKGKVQ